MAKMAETEEMDEMAETVLIMNIYPHSQHLFICLHQLIQENLKQPQVCTNSTLIFTS